MSQYRQISQFLFRFTVTNQSDQICLSGNWNP